MTDEKINKAIELAKTKTIKAIAEELGETYHAIRHALRKRGIKTKAPQAREEEDTDKIAKYCYTYGANKAAIKFGLSIDAVKSIASRVKRRNEKFISEINTESVLKLRWKAFHYARNAGLIEHAEDFASFCVIKKLTNQSVHLDTSLIDYKRETFGDIRCGSGLAKASAELNITAVSHTGHIDEEQKINEIDVGDKEKTLLFGVLEKLEMPEMLRACFVLHYYFGFRMIEIAFIFGIDQQTVTKRIDAAHEVVRRKIKE